MTAVQPEQRELHAASMQSSDMPTDMTAPHKDSSTAGQSDDAAISGTADAAQSTNSLTSTNAACRKAAACARSVLEAERTILAAASKTLRTYVICPGILYGELAGRSTLHSTGCPVTQHVPFSAHLETLAPSKLLFCILPAYIAQHISSKALARQIVAMQMQARTLTSPACAQHMYCRQVHFIIALATMNALQATARQPRGCTASSELHGRLSLMHQCPSMAVVTTSFPPSM